MSVRFDATGEHYTATTGIPGTVFTACWWGRIAVDRNNYSTMLCIDNTTDQQILAVQTDTGGVGPYLWLAPHDPGWIDEAPDTDMVVGTWYRFALVRNGTAITFYMGLPSGTIAIGSATLLGPLTATRLRVGRSTVSTEWWNGNMANLKVYNAALTQAEILTEWGNWRAQRTADLLRHHKWQTAAEGTDYSGNGWTLPVTGTPTFEATNPAIADSDPGPPPAVPSLRVGNAPVSTVRIGVDQATKVYLGATLLWQNTPVTPANPADMTDATALSFTASNAETGNYHRYAASLPHDQMLGLVVQLHGDGFYEYSNPTDSYSIGGIEGIVAQARYRKMITIVARTPDEAGGTWWTNAALNRVYLRELINAILTQYPNVSRSRIWFATYSGGSQIFTQHFLPTQSSHLDGGGAVIFGGGGLPEVTELPYAAGLRANFPMKWLTGTDDIGANETDSPGLFDALTEAQAGSAHYATAGFATVLETPPGNHMVFDGRYGAELGKFMHERGFAGVSASGTATRAATTAASWTGSVQNAPAVTLRVSASPFGTQQGFWEIGAVNLTTRAVTVSVGGLAAGTPYYWRLEIGGNAKHGVLLAGGTVPGTP